MLRTGGGRFSRGDWRSHGVLAGLAGAGRLGGFPEEGGFDPGGPERAPGSDSSRCEDFIWVINRTQRSSGPTRTSSPARVFGLIFGLAELNVLSNLLPLCDSAMHGGSRAESKLAMCVMISFFD